MTNKLISLAFLLISYTVFSQDIKLTEQEMQIKLDSIKTEGNLLYELENASWHSTDLVKENRKMRDSTGIYLTYKSGETVKTVFLNKPANKVISEYTFVNNTKKPSKKAETERELSPLELELKTVREKVIYQLSDKKYEVGVPEGFSLNVIIIPFGEKYKTYLITGASEPGVIPFGNDYLFISDKAGNIEGYKKFHSRLIPTYVANASGDSITIVTHSHLKTTPYISATDICTFKLYAPFTKMERFSVYSPALQTYFEYNYKKNTLAKTKSPL
jgi:hypothetical protein